MKQKSCSFFNELRSFLLFLGIQGLGITLFCSALCLAAQITPTLKKWDL